MKPINEAAVTFLSRSANEGFARTAAACFAAQLDPTLDEVNDIKTAVSEAVTNCIVHAYPDRLGKVSMRLRLFEDNTLEIQVKDWGVGIADVEQARQPLYTTGTEERSGMGFTIMESFMDAVKVRSTPGKGHRGHPAAQGLPPDGGARVSVADTPALLEEARRGDNDACARLIEENAGLIWSIVRRYYGRGTDPEDLYQLGCLGFLKAVRGFDPAFGCQFSTYAVPKIAGEIRRFLRDDGAVKVSRGLKERAGAIRPPGSACPPAWAGSPPSPSWRRRPDWSRRRSPPPRRQTSQWPPSRWRRGTASPWRACWAPRAWRRPSWSGRPCGERWPPCPSGNGRSSCCATSGV